MPQPTKIQKLELANRSLKRVLAFEQKNVKRNDIVNNLKRDIGVKDEVIGRQTQELARIYKSKLWQIYLFFKPFLSLFKILLLLSLFFPDYSFDFT